MDYSISYDTPRRQRMTLRAWLYVWRPLLLSVGSAALVILAVVYAYAVHVSVREALDVEKQTNARLTAMLNDHDGRGITLAYVNTQDMGRAAIRLVPAGR